MNSRKSLITESIVSAISIFRSQCLSSVCSLKQKPCLRDPLLMPPPIPEPSHKFSPSTMQPWRRNLNPRFPHFRSVSFQFFTLLSLSFASTICFLSGRWCSHRRGRQGRWKRRNRRRGWGWGRWQRWRPRSYFSLLVSFFFLNQHVYIYYC